MSQQLITKINGADIVTVDRDGETFVPIKPICQALGINYTTQLEKLQNDETLSTSVVPLRGTTGADGKAYGMVCIPVKYVFGWLFTINPKNVAPEAREAVKAYRNTCYDILYEHFVGQAKRQREQLEAEKRLLDGKAEELNAIENYKKCIASCSAKIKRYDAQLEQLQTERLNPQPTLF